MGAVYRFFVAGIIQGSKCDLTIHSQTYRQSVTKILKNYFPKSHVYCPVENHPNSLSYSDTKAKHVFLQHVKRVRNSHCVVVYLPEASMGSSIEMWEGFNHNTAVVTISPMIKNWVVRILSDKICGSLEAFDDFVETGGLERLLKKRYPDGIKVNNGDSI